MPRWMKEQNVAGGWVTADSVKTWYPTINKPSFTPPNWLFGPVWTVLYVLMGVAAWRVWCNARRPARGPLMLFAVQLALNLAWSVVFFGAHRIGGAVAVIVALEIAIEEVFFHCAKAFLRSDAWKPETWNPTAVPTVAQLAKAIKPEVSDEELQKYYSEENMRKVLY